MRELKFRVWGKTEKEYIRYPFVWLSIFDSPDGLELEENEDLVLEQYTGLKDKNGKEIYEGDIIESTWNNDKAEVVWNDVEGEWENYADFNTHSKYSGSVVIGNIHENPELLGDKE